MANLGTAQIAQAWPVFAAQGALTEVTYTRHSAATLNIATGAISTLPVTTTTLLGLLSRYSLRQIDGVRVLAGDRRFHMPKTAVALPPRRGDVVTVDTVPWQVQDVIDSANGGLWECQLREAAGAQVRAV